MKSAADYLDHVKALIILHPHIVRWETVREEMLGEKGLFRYRLMLEDGRLLEAFSYFQVAGGKVQIMKYSFHWQDEQGQLYRRWDNAAHHPEVATHPHHVHKGSDTNVSPHGPVDIDAVLSFVAEESSNKA